MAQRPKAPTTGKGTRKSKGAADTSEVEFVYFLWRDSSRQTFALGNKDFTFVPSAGGEGGVPIKNKIEAQFARELEHGRYKRYIENHLLVKTHPPADKVEAGLVHEVRPRRGIVESRASQTARRKAEATTTAAELEAKLDRILAQQEGDREIVRLQTAVIEKLEGQLDAKKAEAGAAERERVDTAKEAAQLRAKLAAIEASSPAGAPAAEPVTLPFEPGEVGADDMAAKLEEIKPTKAQLQVLLLAEATGKNRKKAVAAITEALRS